MTATVLRPSWARRVGVVWLVAGAGLVLAGAAAMADGGGPGWELVVGVAAFAVGWWYARRRVALDPQGLDQAVGWRRTRLLWSVVDRVVVPPRTGPLDALAVELSGRGTVELTATRGLSRAQWHELVGAVEALTGQTGVPVAHAGAGAPDPR